VRRTTEDDLATAFAHQPGREPGPAGVGPEAFLVGAADREQHPRPAGGERGEERGDGPVAGRIDPVLVVAVVDRVPLGPEQVEVTLRLVPAGPGGDRRGEQRAAALRREADPVGNAGEGADHGRGERPLEQVAPRVGP